MSFMASVFGAAAAAAVGPSTDTKAPAPAAGAGPPVGGPVRALLLKTGKKGGQFTGLKPLRLRMPYSVAFNSTAVTGVVSSSLLVVADSNTTEWAAIATLYDEYRVRGGVVKFAVGYQTPAGVFGTDAALFCMAYDPVDGSQATSVRQLTETSQHVLFAAQASSAATNSTALQLSFGRAAGAPYQLRFKTESLAAFNGGTGAITNAAGQWKKINAAGANNPDGAIKVYGTSDFTTVQIAVSGIVYLDVEFRVRT